VVRFFSEEPNILNLDLCSNNLKNPIKFLQGILNITNLENLVKILLQVINFVGN